MTALGVTDSPASFLLPILPADDRSGSFTSFRPLPRVRLGADVMAVTKWSISGS